MSKMTRWQEQAFVKPCRLGEETMLPEYAHRLGAKSTLVLTINSGYE